MEDAARLIMGTMSKALRDGDHATVSTMLSEDSQAKADAVGSEQLWLASATPSGSSQLLGVPGRRGRQLRK